MYMTFFFSVSVELLSIDINSKSRITVFMIRFLRCGVLRCVCKCFVWAIRYDRWILVGRKKKSRLIYYYSVGDL